LTRSYKQGRGRIGREHKRESGALGEGGGHRGIKKVYTKKKGRAQAGAVKRERESRNPSSS